MSVTTGARRSAFSETNSRVPIVFQFFRDNVCMISKLLYLFSSEWLQQMEQKHIFNT